MTEIRLCSILINMPSTTNTTPSSHRKVWIIAAILLAFVAGLLVSRVRYKPQIRATFNLVQDQTQEISELKAQIKTLEDKMLMEAKTKK